MGDGRLVNAICPFSNQCGSGELCSAREGKRENFPAVGHTVMALTNICLLHGMSHKMLYRDKKKNSGMATQAIFLKIKTTKCSSNSHGYFKQWLKLV